MKTRTLSLLLAAALLAACTAHAGELHGDSTFTGTLDLSGISNAASVRGALGTNDAGNLDTGTLANARLSAQVLLSTGTYSNPSWLTGLAWSKLSGTPSNLAGYGITDAQAAITVNGIVKGNGSGTLSAASTTGTGSVVQSTGATLTNPTLTGASISGGTIDAAALAFGTVPAARGGAGTVNGILTANGSGTVSAASTSGSGSVVLATAPTLASATVTGTLTAGRVYGDGAGAGEHILRQSGSAYTDNVLGLQNASYSLGSPVTVSAVNTSTETLTTSATHGLPNDSVVQFASTGTLPGGLTAGTDYWVINATSTTLQVTAAYGGGAVDLTSAGTGSITVRSIGHGFSALELFRHYDNLGVSAPFAMGLNGVHGPRVLNNRVFFSTVDTNDPTAAPIDMVFVQQQGPSANWHSRLLFNGTAHTTELYGWDTTNATEAGPLALHITEDGRVGVQTTAPLAGCAMEVNGNMNVTGPNLSIGGTSNVLGTGHLLLQADAYAYIDIRPSTSNHITYSTFGGTGSGDGHVFVTGATPTVRVQIRDDRVKVSNILALTPQSAPSSPAEGDVYASSSDHHLYFYNGSAWKQLDN